MMIMPSTHNSGFVHYLAGRYPGLVGWLVTPRAFRKPVYYMPYAVDNGCFKRWEEDKFYHLLRRLSLFKNKPLWVAVPDVVADAEMTLKMWHENKDRILTFGYKLAFVCQDGHEPQDVPVEAYCCFIGGSTEWKLNNAEKFKGITEYLHIGRVNQKARIRWAKDIGADSIDGTGYFRGCKYTNNGFIEYFEGDRNLQLFD